jgi:methyl-accepting chemotaxis protein
MEEVVNSVRRVTDIVAEISSASQEQSQGIEQINRAITQMDEVTQQNAALVEQAAAAAQSMQEQASHLSEVVAVFKLDERSALAKSTTAPALRTVDINHKLGNSRPTSPSIAKVTAKPVALKKPAPTSDDTGSWEQF